MNVRGVAELVDVLDELASLSYCIVPNKRSLHVDTLVNSESPEEQFRGFSAIFAHFGPIFGYFREYSIRKW